MTWSRSRYRDENSDESPNGHFVGDRSTPICVDDTRNAAIAAVIDVVVRRSPPSPGSYSPGDQRRRPLPRSRSMNPPRPHRSGSETPRTRPANTHLATPQKPTSHRKQRALCRTQHYSPNTRFEFQFRCISWNLRTNSGVEHMTATSSYRCDQIATVILDADPMMSSKPSHDAGHIAVR